MKKKIWISEMPGVLGLTLACAMTAWAQEVRVTGLEFVGATELSLEFSDDGSGQPADFGVDGTDDLMNWSPVTGVYYSDLGNGNWAIALPRAPGEAKRFFRVTKFGEPVTGALTAPTSTVREGESGGVEVVFSRVYNGELSYQVDFGDGTPPQAGTLQVDGQSVVTIPVTVPDDADAMTLRSLTVSISGGAVELTGLTTMSVTVEDNDSEWAGVLTSDADGAPTQVGLKVAAVNGVTTAVLSGDAGGIFPATPGGWPATWNADGQGLSASTMDMIVPAADAIYAAETKFALGLNASGAGAVKFSDGLISGYEGTFTLTSSVESLPHLSIPDRTGAFTLFRKPGLVPPAPETTPISQ